MSRTLTSAVTTSIGLPVTEPGYFVELLFATPLHLSSRETINWNGADWLTWDIKLRGFGVDGAGSTQSGTLILGNADLSIGALVLGEGVADRHVNIWKFYGSAPDVLDPVQIFGGAGDDSRIDADGGTVSINLRPAAGVTLYSPRAYMTQESGWNFLPAPGAVIVWGKEVLTLAAEGG
jgi:hypothetical protein